MSDKKAVAMETGRMGAVWVASLSLMGISAIGVTRADALAGVVKALQTHDVDCGQSNEIDCDACS